MLISNGCIFYGLIYCSNIVRRTRTCVYIQTFRSTTGYFSKYLSLNRFFNHISLYGFINCSNIFRSCFKIHTWFFNLFLRKIISYTSSPTSPTVISNNFTTYTTTDAFVSPYGTTDALIASSSFKLESNSLTMTLLLKS